MIFSFEKICRQNFDLRYEQDPRAGVTFYTDALAANNSKPESENVRIIIMAKVLVGTCVKRIEEGAAEIAGQSISINNKTGLPIDTYTDDTQTVFFKFQMSEVYPEFLLVYRDKTAAPDTRGSKLPLEYCKVSYRSGTRINPQDEVAIKLDDDPDKIETIGVTFDKESTTKKPKLETVDVGQSKLPGKRFFLLKRRVKQNKNSSVLNNDIELGEKHIEE